MLTSALDIMAIAAHRDDVEQTCGGTLLKMAELGHRTGILDLTQGEMGTRGSAEERAREAEQAAKILKVEWRQGLDIPDGRVENTWENRLKVARVIRQTRPGVVILPYWKGRHPDHYTSSKLGYEACFLAGLAKLDIERALSVKDSAFSQVASAVASVVAGEKQTRSGKGAGSRNAELSGAVEDTSGAVLNSASQQPHRPFKIVYATLYHDIRPTFVVDITQQFEARLQSIYAYKSQYTDQEAGRNDFPAHAEIRERVATMAGFYGLLAGVKYAEPFVQKEIGLVEDVTAIPVKSI